MPAFFIARSFCHDADSLACVVSVFDGAMMNVSSDVTHGLPAVEALPVRASDGAQSDVLLQLPAGPAERLLYWLPAMGVSARQYLPLAQALAGMGIAVVVHEWRGIGSSNRRASRRQDWGYRTLLRDDVPAGLAAARQRLPQAGCVLGGHSLGGQLAALYASLHPGQVDALVAVASGAPYWRQFRHGALIGLAYVAAPWLARLFGHLPGRRIGFGGNEARGVIDDWARSGRTGRYAAVGVAEDVEQRLRALALPMLAVRMADDWLGPQASLDWLLGKMPHNRVERQLLDASDFDGRRADHFGWMKTPGPVARRIAAWMAALP